MKIKGLMVAAVAVVGVWSAEALPAMSLRLRGPHTATEEQWKKTLAAIAANPGCCDEVWFSTGIGVPSMEWHRAHAARLVRAAAELRKLGIVPSLQVQATLGHSDSLSASEDCSAKHWTGWTGSKGVEDKYCNCPRQPAFLAYVREMARVYASFHPGSVWVDDDLRISNHRPATDNSRLGCWCAKCIADFNAAEQKNWTRESLDAAIAKDGSIGVRWKAFQVQSIAQVAKIVTEEFAKVSPETRMGYQHCFDDASVDSVKAVVAAMQAGSGHPVGLRPGGGAYYDLNPCDQIEKSITAAAFCRKIGNPAGVELWCPEIESWPRAYGSRSAQSVIAEGFTALMYGMNSTSMLVLDTRYETDELYSRTLLKPLADAAPVLKAYLKANADTEPVGFDAGKLSPHGCYQYALTGVPVLPGTGRKVGEISSAESKLFICAVGSKTVQEHRDALDKRAKGLPAVLESPFVGLMVPQATKDGKLRTVALLNTRIDGQGPITMRLRGVPNGAKAVWRELRRSPVELPVTRAGELSRVTIPELGAWNGGFIEIQE